jgi:hypothetical protein
MNTGLQDAYNIAWKLAFVLKGYAKPSLLSTYNEERLPFARWLLKFTDRAFSVMTSDNWFIAKFRKYVALKLVGIVLSKKFIKPTIFRTISQIAYTHRGKSLSFTANTRQKLNFKTGDRLPYITYNYYAQFTDPVFHLIHISDKPAQNASALQTRGLFPFPTKLVENTIEQWRSFGVRSELFILVRPDNYISLISDTINKGLFDQHFKRHFTENHSQNNLSSASIMTQ